MERGQWEKKERKLDDPALKKCGKPSRREGKEHIGSSRLK